MSTSKSESAVNEAAAAEVAAEGADTGMFTHKYCQILFLLEPVQQEADIFLRNTCLREDATAVLTLVAAAHTCVGAHLLCTS